ncbi:MAG TPA: glucose-6-phosphate dehydrogenase assembly protein OpcA [Gaiellaceae bacterium]|nr:glucose-6-phosphate dehydrogenase assembly protein OpcA [Gaiellaceae bacterium]
MSTAVHAVEWSGQDVEVGDVVRALCRLREESAHETTGPDLRTSVMTHLAWVPSEWEEAAVGTLAGLGERHPSRGILLFPEPEASDGIDARVSILAFPLREQRRHIAAEVVELRLRGRSSRAAASIVNPLLVPGLPVFLRWRGRPPFGQSEVDQLIDVTDRLIYDSTEWPDTPRAYEELPFDRAACSDIAWRRTEPWRGVLARLWPGVGEARLLRVRGPVAEASLLVGWLRSRLHRKVELEHEDGDEVTEIVVDDMSCSAPREHPTSSDLLSAELDEFGRDPVYEAAARRAFA